MVVMNGEAITAGSKPSRLAIRGREQPTIFATSTVTHRVRHTVTSTQTVTLELPISSRSTSITLPKHSTASTRPQSTAVRSSFQMTLKISLNLSSSRLRARMTVTEDWEPLLPPVSISMGMNTVRMGRAPRDSSKELMIIPVKVADTISSISQGIRCLNRSKGELAI